MNLPNLDRLHRSNPDTLTARQLQVLLIHRESGKPLASTADRAMRTVRLGAEVPALLTHIDELYGQIEDLRRQLNANGVELPATSAEQPATRSPRRWPLHSPEPQEDGLVVRSTHNGVRFRYRASWGSWVALPPEGDDREHTWYAMNHPLGWGAAELVEVLTEDGGR
jgi:hypothetical protein